MVIVLFVKKKKKKLKKQNVMSWIGNLSKVHCLPVGTMVMFVEQVH